MFSLTSKSPAHPHLVLPTLAKMVSQLSQKLKQHPLFFPLYYPSQWLYHCESCFYLRYIAASASISLWPHCRSFVQTSPLPPLDLDYGNSSQQVFLHPLFSQFSAKQPQYSFENKNGIMSLLYLKPLVTSHFTF